MTWLGIAAVGLVAAFVQGSAGFGYGLVAMALLGLWLGVPEAAAYTVLGALTVNGVMLWRLRAHVQVREQVPILLGVLVGAPLGVLLLAQAAAGILHLLLGIVLVVATLHMALRGRQSRAVGSSGWHPVYAGLPCGVLSGAMSGAFGTGGPPLVAYVTSQGYDRLRYAATVQLLLAVSGLVRLVEMLRHGILTSEMLPVALLTAAAAAIGAILGVACLRRIPERIFRPAIIFFLFALGVRYIARWALLES